MATSKEQLETLAWKAISRSEGAAKYIAIDTEGTVYAYKQKPVIKSEASTVWDISDLKQSCWLVCYTEAPDNFRDELYKISKILDNEND